MTLNTSGDEETAGVWPGDDLVLTPPPCNNDGHIESKNKGDRDQVSKPLAVERDLLKLYLSRLSESKPVCEGQCIVEDHVQEQVLPNQLIDAPLPLEQ